MAGFFSKQEGQHAAAAVSPEGVAKTLAAAKNIEHEMEFVARISGVDYINDSASTSLDRTWKSLATAGSNIVWIAGDPGDNADFRMLAELVKDKVNAIVCIGKTGNCGLVNAYADVVDCIVDAQSIEEAVHASYCTAKSGHTVLFSPACGSYDSFSSYRERGRSFKNIVTNIYRELLRP